MRTLRLPGGGAIPVLGQGTWGMGERAGSRAAEVAALRHGLELGLTPDRHRRDVRRGRCRGGGRRGDPRPARRGVPGQQGLPAQRVGAGTIAACERSLKRLGTDRLDLYLLHWRGSHPLAETVAAFERLRRDGKIRHWGVSNLDADEMAELLAVPDGARCAANQVLYNPSRRGIEWDLLPWCREHGIPVMAYSPIEQGRLPTDGALADIAPRPRLQPVPGGAGLGAGAAGRGGDPEGGPARACRGQRRGARPRALAPTIWPRSTAQFPPPRSKRPLAML